MFIYMANIRLKDVTHVFIGSVGYHEIVLSTKYLLESCLKCIMISHPK